MVLKSGHLLTIKGNKVRSLDMRLCTVRVANAINMQMPTPRSSKEGGKDDKAERAFEIVSAQKKMVSK